MTEDEAKTKWCPFARTTLAVSDGNQWSYAHDAPSAHNRVGFDAASGRTPIALGPCLGSGCMAWRSDGNPGPHWVHKSVREEWERDGWTTDGVENDRGQITFTRTAGGYCGLAGAPQ